MLLPNNSKVVKILNDVSIRRLVWHKRNGMCTSYHSNFAEQAHILGRGTLYRNSESLKTAIKIESFFLK